MLQHSDLTARTAELADRIDAFLARPVVMSAARAAFARYRNGVDRGDIESIGSLLPVDPWWRESAMTQRHLEGYAKDPVLMPEQRVAVVAAYREAHLPGVEKVAAFPDDPLGRACWARIVKEVLERSADESQPWFLQWVKSQFRHLENLFSDLPPTPDAQADPTKRLNALAEKAQRLVSELGAEDGGAPLSAEWRVKLDVLWHEARSAKRPGGEPLPDWPIEEESWADAERHARELLDFITRQRAGASPPDPIEPPPPPCWSDGVKTKRHADGPEGGCWVWWEGVRHDVPKGVIYRIIDFMWNRSSAHYDDVMGQGTPIWDDPVMPSTVRSKLCEANAVLRDIGIPWRLKANATSRHITKHSAE
jgi:hypothetical protein